MTKTNSTNIKKTGEQFMKTGGPIVDWLAKVLAGAFFLATAYGYVAGWLKLHQSQHDLSVAGGILTVAVALYLYSHKR